MSDGKMFATYGIFALQLLFLSLSLSLSLCNDSYVPHLPSAGETLRATKFQNGFGGKGANQCVAAAKLGSSTALISKVNKIRIRATFIFLILIFRSHQMQFGDDEWADKYDDHLKKFGVCSKFIDRVAGKSTGLAQINVAENGENQIVIIPGANDSLSPSDVENAAELLDSSKVS